MMTDEDFWEVAQAAYTVDPKWKNLPAKEGTQFPFKNPRFQIIGDPVSDPVTGFQGIAVVPLVNGEPDYGHAYVAFAGTNPADHADLNADVQVVIGGKAGAATQAAQAKAYAEKVRSQVRTEHPEATFETVGHSLGGYLAMLVAGELHWSATSFNGPDVWDALSPQDREWLMKQIAAGKNPFRNNVNEWDIIGNSRGNKSGAAVYVKGTPGLDPLSYHNLDSGFDYENGALKGAGAAGRSKPEIGENLLQAVPPEFRGAFADGLAGALKVLQNPVVGESVGRFASAAMIAMDTLAASSLASTIFSTSDLMTQVKSLNDGLVPQLRSGLAEAQNAVFTIPFITEADIRNCVITHRLRVEDNVDEDAIAEVDRLLDDHVDTVHKLSSGIGTALANAVNQDAQWASIFAGR